MAGTFPKFKLYQSDGVTFVYEITAVTDWSPHPLSNPQTFTEHQSLRGQGSIISEGSLSPWDFSLTFRLSAIDYETLIGLMQTTVNTIIFNTKYILKIDLTIGGSTKDLKVKLLTPITFPITNNNNKVVTSQQGNMILRVNTWI